MHRLLPTTMCDHRGTRSAGEQVKARLEPRLALGDAGFLRDTTVASVKRRRRDAPGAGPAKPTAWLAPISTGR